MNISFYALAPHVHLLSDRVCQPFLHVACNVYQEMLEDQLLRQRTREYIDLLRAILFEAESGSQVTEMNDAMEDGSDGSPSPKPLASLSESGLIVLNDSNLRPVIFLTLLRFVFSFSIFS